MRYIIPFLSVLTISLVTTFALPSQSPYAPAIARNTLSRRAEPNTGGDFPDGDPDLDKVEQAFKDAIELCSYVITAGIDTPSPIFAK